MKNPGQKIAIGVVAIMAIVLIYLAAQLALVRLDPRNRRELEVDKGQLVLTVLEDGAIKSGNMHMNLKELDRELARIEKKGKDRSGRPVTGVVIGSHPKAPFKHIIEVIDACKQHNIRNVSIKTSVTR